MRHVLRVEQFERGWIDDELLPVTRQLLLEWPAAALAGREIFNLFQQPSFLTRLAFSRAVRRLGGQHEQADFENAFTVEARRQTIEDEVRILNGLEYSAIVVRADAAGGAERAAAISSVPIINGGEPLHRASLGSAQHPTQALSDLATIGQALGRIDDLNVAIVPGDGASLVIVQSLAMLLAGVCRQLRLTLVVRPALAPLFTELSAALQDMGAECRLASDIRAVSATSDVLYFAQANNLHLGVAERYHQPDEQPGVFVLTEEILQGMPPSAIVMHPLPRNIGATSAVPAELPEALTSNPRVRCFEQARMKHIVAGALLYLLLAARA